MSKKCIITPDCPRCGSKKTGYYINVSSTAGLARIISQRLSRGELVRFTSGFPDENQPDLFCENCGLEWYGEYKSARLSFEEIEELKKEKDISEKEIRVLNKSEETAKKNRKKRRRQIFKNKFKNKK